MMTTHSQDYIPNKIPVFHTISRRWNAPFGLIFAPVDCNLVAVDIAVWLRIMGEAAWRLQQRLDNPGANLPDQYAVFAVPTDGGLANVPERTIRDAIRRLAAAAWCDTKMMPEVSMGRGGVIRARIPAVDLEVAYRAEPGSLARRFVGVEMVEDIARIAQLRTLCAARLALFGAYNGRRHYEERELIWRDEVCDRLGLPAGIIATNLRRDLKKAVVRINDVWPERRLELTTHYFSPSGMRGRGNVVTHYEIMWWPRSSSTQSLGDTPQDEAVVSVAAPTAEPDTAPNETASEIGVDEMEAAQREAELEPSEDDTYVSPPENDDGYSAREERLPYDPKTGELLMDDVTGDEPGGFDPESGELLVDDPTALLDLEDDDRQL